MTMNTPIWESYLKIIADNLGETEIDFDFYPGNPFIVIFRFGKQPEGWVFKFNHSRSSMAKCISTMLNTSAKFKLEKDLGNLIKSYDL